MECERFFPIFAGLVYILRLSLNPLDANSHVTSNSQTKQDVDTFTQIRKELFRHRELDSAL
jgi:hypothetical protein